MGSFMRFFLLPFVCALVLVFVGCSGAPTEAKKAEAPVEPISGQSALFRMYQVARSWAPDAQVLKMNSIQMSDVPEVRGKAGAWQVTFVSMEKSAARSYTYSVVEGEGNLHQGVFPGPIENWNGPAGRVFLIGDVKIDTDAAYQTARAKVADYDQSHPKETIAFTLEREEKSPSAAWRVIWGESAATSGVSVLIDATTGTYLQTLH